ncbi:hypothetical protein HanOQP8_Chr17g0668621 [Helianthus annuus]|nr:hypothetical protein HanIR_Chr17g0883401 [Helianthus annuus]KAJ0636996.1 hypothetical protein HanOQP8_Chr17g0668621 [Helianthus annuus]KAJ0814077.1 hypothetical protein HanPSC8_Chr17g0781241 [Helianthus annuus]
MAPKSFILFTLLSYSLSFLTISAVDYYVTNVAADTPGGIRFTNEIGIPYTKQIMGTINNFIWSTVFQQNDPSERNPIDSVNVYIVEFDGAEAIEWGGNNINVSSIYLKGYEGDLKWQFTSLFYHEMTHCFQWDGEGHTPLELVEGVADYTKLIAGYAQEGFAKPGQGDRWDQGYDFTARFLEYCDGIVPGFVAKLNKKMRFDYDVKYFEDLTGKPVDQLWKEYKDKYRN